MHKLQYISQVLGGNKFQFHIRLNYIKLEIKISPQILMQTFNTNKNSD